MDAPNDSMSWAGLLDNELAGFFFGHFGYYSCFRLFCFAILMFSGVLLSFLFFFFVLIFYIIYSFHLVLPVVFNELFSKLLSNFNYFRFDVS
jgi:hypothetical protein